MFEITDRRKRRLCRELLLRTGGVVGLADVGSGGPLKRPWRLLPATHLEKFDFEPTHGNGALPVCVSNRAGRAQLFVARDERGSSLHKPLATFAQRFGQWSHLTARTIQVECTTLDSLFRGRYDAVDAVDINVEGHDYQVLQGGLQLLDLGAVKLLKVEFELAAVWEGQGWLSDIDPLLRSHGYILAGIDIERARPVSVQRYFHPGEPLWGKALYVPGPEQWTRLLQRFSDSSEALEQAVAKAAALYVAADLLGQAFDVLDRGFSAGPLARLEPLRIKERIAAAYRWARLEHGARSFVRLAGRAVGVGSLGPEP
jgi:FkbM family methyltransferase